MKVIAINGSPRKGGNTDTGLQLMGEVFQQNGIEFEVLQIGIKPINGCMACGKCSEIEKNLCVINNDVVNEWTLKLAEADGIILASPVHYSGIAGNMKSAIDRLFYHKAGMFKYKVGAVMCATRRAGASSTIDQLMHYLTLNEMIVVGSTYWNIVHGKEKGEMVKDAEGVQTLLTLADNMSWMLKVIENGKGVIEKPEPRMKEWTHFVRD